MTGYHLFIGFYDLLTVSCPFVQGIPGFPGPPGIPGPSVKCPCHRRSAFTVKLSGQLPSPSKPVPFTEVLYNAQKDLQEDTGVFTCRVPGNYHFLFDVDLHHCKVTVQLMRDKSSVLEKHQVSTKEPTIPILLLCLSRRLNFCPYLGLELITCFCCCCCFLMSDPEVFLSGFSQA